MFLRKGQITLFVILAIVIVAIIGLTVYFTARPLIPAKLMPVEDKVLECISDAVEDGTGILGEQAGYIGLPLFESGSEAFPFTSQIDFFGSVMPYWFYVDKRGFYQEQVPSLSGMQRQLEEYVNARILDCDFSQFLDEGYEIETENEVKTSIEFDENEVYAEVEWPVTITFGDTVMRITAHGKKIPCTLKRRYDIAKEIYEKEMDELFFENYAVDVIALYAPTTDVELSCAPKIWSREQVLADLKNALAVNFASIKFSGNYYSLLNKEERYFVQDLDKELREEQVNVLYDSSFPTKINVFPGGEIMRADPVGIQEGLGVLGFCYVPYHFVYSVSYPVLVQVFDEDFKIFQFPLIVSVESNKPRGAVKAEQPEEAEAELCRYKVQEISLRTIDRGGKTVDADISFKCHNTVCSIGKTRNGELETEFPQCANGFVLADAEGYATSSVQLSTNEPASAEIILRKVHDLDLEVLKPDALEEDESALVIFSSEDYTTSVFWPFEKKINLIEGSYDITAHLFREGKITLSAQSMERCTSIPREGLLGILGFEREECFTIDMPSQELESLTVGGGMAALYFEDEELEKAKAVEVTIAELATPKSIFELQDIYNIIETSEIGVELK